MNISKHILVLALMTGVFLPATSCTAKVNDPVTGEDVILSDETPEDRREAYDQLEVWKEFYSRIVADPTASEANKASARDHIARIIEQKAELQEMGF